MRVSTLGGKELVSSWDSLRKAKKKVLFAHTPRFADFYLAFGDPYRGCLSPEVIRTGKHLLSFQQVPTRFAESKPTLPEEAPHLLFKLINPGLNPLAGFPRGFSAGAADALQAAPVTVLHQSPLPSPAFSADDVAQTSPARADVFRANCRPRTGFSLNPRGRLSV